MSAEIIPFRRPVGGSYDAAVVEQNFKRRQEKRRRKPSVLMHWAHDGAKYAIECFKAGRPDVAEWVIQEVARNLHRLRSQIDPEYSRVQGDQS